MVTSFGHLTNPLLTKLVRLKMAGYWPTEFFICVFMGRDEAISTSRVVNNAYRFTTDNSDLNIALLDNTSIASRKIANNR